MKLDPCICPFCGGKPRGILQRLPGIAEIGQDGKGGWEYTGSTDVWWDDQENDEGPNHEVYAYCSDCGKYWEAHIEENLLDA